MGNPKQKWTAAEEDALKKGIAKHGTGKWKVILRDPEFEPILHTRSNIDLKDKWRNMGVFSGGGQRQRDKNGADSTFNAVLLDTTSEKVDPGFAAMIFEAIEGLNDPNGSSPPAIFDYIQERHEVPANFRRHLSGRLRKLAAKGKLIKTSHPQASYKLNPDDVSTTTMPPVSNQTNIMSAQLQGMVGSNKPAGDMANPLNSDKAGEENRKEDDSAVDMEEDVDSDLETANQFEADMLQHQEEEVAEDESIVEVTEEMVDKFVSEAANCIANAENKSFVAVGAIKEEERIAQMAVDTENNLQLIMAMYEQCERGEPVHLNIG